MKLLCHNMIVCNDPHCERAFPLIVEVDKSIYKQSDFHKETIIDLAEKIHWSALHQTVVNLGEENFPKKPFDHLDDE